MQVSRGNQEWRLRGTRPVNGRRGVILMNFRTLSLKIGEPVGALEVGGWRVEIEAIADICKIKPVGL